MTTIDREPKWMAWRERVTERVIADWSRLSTSMPSDMKPADTNRLLVYVTMDVVSNMLRKLYKAGLSHETVLFILDAARQHLEDRRKSELQ